MNNNLSPSPFHVEGDHSGSSAKAATSVAGHKRALLFAWLALFVVWFGTLDYRTLVRPDEGRYAEIPREMTVTGDWLTPRLNGIKYFEKPPLQYWATAVAYKAFGEHEWTARLWPALTGFLSVLLAWWTGRRLWGTQAGNLAAAILSSMLLYIGMSHLITLDMGLGFFLQVAWTAFLFAQRDETGRWRRWAWLMWASLALAVLSKGIVALVLCGGTLVGYTLWHRDLTPWKRLAPVTGVVLFLLIAAPWFVAVSRANPEFARFFFIHEHFERFLTKVHRRYKPDWYFIPVYLLGALPWTFMLLHALVKSVRREAERFQTQRFLVLWAALTFVFFSLSDSKLPPYIVPIFPAMALLGGRHLANLSRRALLWHLGVLSVLMPLLMGLVMYVEKTYDQDSSDVMIQGFLHWVWVAGGLQIAATFTAFALGWARRNTAALYSLAIGGMIGTHGLMLGHDNLSLSSSSAYIAKVARPLLTPGVPFYSVQRYEQTLPFYLKRTITVVSSPDELEFGLQQEPEKWIPSPEEFRRRWMSDRDAFAIMSLEVYDYYRHLNLPMTEIARDDRNIIVRKPQ